jgi:predicted GTPase
MELQRLPQKKFGAQEPVDPKPYAVGSTKETLARYPHLSAVLPAVGISKMQITELEEIINKTPCDVVLIGTPSDLHRIIKVNKPTARVKYNLQLLDNRRLAEVLDNFLKGT